jgi:hypothetical protein
MYSCYPQQILLVDHIATLREAVATTRQSHAFKIGTFVVSSLICMRSVVQRTLDQL